MVFPSQKWFSHLKNGFPISKNGFPISKMVFPSQKMVFPSQKWFSHLKKWFSHLESVLPSQKIKIRKNVTHTHTDTSPLYIDHHHHRHHHRSWGFRLIGGRDEGLVLKVDKVCFYLKDNSIQLIKHSSQSQLIFF